MLSRKTRSATSSRQSWLLASITGGLFLLLALSFVSQSGIVGSQRSVSTLVQNLAGAIPTGLRTLLLDQARVMSIPLEAGSPAFWYIARAGGIIAYFLLWLATCWGIMMSSKVIQGYFSFARAYDLHEFLPLLGIIFATLHALVLLGDTYIGFSIGHLLIPFSSSYEPLWTGLGSLALYLLLILLISSYIRKQIGQKTWRAFHYMSYLAFLLVLLHGLMAGTDSGEPAIRGLYFLTGGISLFLLLYRLLSYTPRRISKRVER